MYKLSASLLALSLLSLTPAMAIETQDPVLVASSNVAITQTRQGQVQGFKRGDIFTFRGMPYATAERFKAPRPPAGWQGVRPALSYGNVCPQPVSTELREPQTFISDTRFWPQSENCLNLNIWTPGLNDSKKRPVMVWLHGGGFFSGSSMELPIYDGTNLSQKGDVVVVSINHRLNILGFLDLSAYGPGYKYSGNAGMDDIVAALAWVHDNIEAFGGDPSNVTIFGQSGGGAKVGTLLYAPSAKGLYSKAIIQSGVMGGGPDAGNQTIARRVTELTFAEAGLTSGDVQGLTALPYDQLSAAGDRALRKVSNEIAPGSGGPLGFPIVNWGPTADGDFLPQYPFTAGAPTGSADVPLLIGSTLNEFQMIPTPDKAGRATWGEAEATAYFRNRYGEAAPRIVADFKAAYPSMAPKDWAVVDSMGRAGVLRAAKMKATQTAPVYTYLFAWQSPILDGFWGAGHSTDLTFTFDNADLGAQATGGGPKVAALADQMSQAWINFARGGNPNQPGLPHWDRFTASGGDTMIFDTQSNVRRDHDKDLMTLLSAAPPHP